MMEVTVHIEAKELAAALLALSGVVGGKTTMPLAEEHPVLEPFTPPMAQPVQPVAPTAMAPTPVPAPVAAASPVPAPAPVPTAPPSYSYEQIAQATASYADQSDAARGQVLALLQKYNLRSLPELPKEQYGAFATELRQLGARL